MSKKCKCEKAADIPEWIVTYSDTITLLMTFFILLLTFATSEPEKFQQLQSVMFGGSRATGMVAPTPRRKRRRWCPATAALLAASGSDARPTTPLESVSRAGGLARSPGDEDLDRFEIVVSCRS